MMDIEQGRLDQAPWWHDAVGYQVYIRSFADSTGDGVGDLEGIRAHLGHLEELGVNTLWVTPFYPSPMADFGYDVSDYCNVDPLFGELGSVQKLTDDAHRRGIRVVVDLVPNHCSDQHFWFQEALRDPGGKYRDYFIWRDPGSGGSPPNNWVGCFGGSAWTRDAASGQYYLHLFLPEQPDLNWRNPAVRDEFDRILRFWLELGVDGFRIDVAHALIKDEQLRSNPQIAPWDPAESRYRQWGAFVHAYDVVQPETVEIYNHWRGIVEPYDAVLIGETYVMDAADLAKMLVGDGLHLGFWFKPMHMAWDASQVRDAIRDPLEQVSDQRMIAWVSSSHDDVRTPTRFGGGDLGRRRALAFSMVLFSLPGTPFIYQGEELGLEQSVLPEESRADPVGENSSQSRDGCRTPMTWSSGTSFGFSSHESPWLPQTGRAFEDTVEFQRDHPGSWMQKYSELCVLRQSEHDLRHAPVEWLDDETEDVLRFARGSLIVIVNLGDCPACVGAAGVVVYSNVDRLGEVEMDTKIEPDEALIVRRRLV